MDRRALYKSHFSLSDEVDNGGKKIGREDVEFQVLSWFSADVEEGNEDGENDVGSDEDDDDEDDLGSEYLIKMFGVARNGDSVAVTVTGFTPFFYFLVPPSLVRASAQNGRIFNRSIPEAVLEVAQRCGVKEGGVKDVRVLNKKDFWGFKGGHLDTFVRVTLRRHSYMRSMAGYMSRNTVRVNGTNHKFELYESNIDPVLRFIHVRDLDSAGWVRIPAAQMKKGEDCDALPATPHVNRDVSVCWKHVHPLRDESAQGVAPLLVAAFDIECNSSHGDFPVAVTSYRRLAVDLVAYYDDHLQTRPGHLVKARLAACVRHALGCLTDEDVGEVAAAEEEARSGSEAGGCGARICDSITTVTFKRPEDGTKPKRVLRTQNAVDACIDDVYNSLIGRWTTTEMAVEQNNGKKEMTVEERASTCVTRITSVTEVFASNGFPELKGDEVIQIGTTFHVYGSQRCCYRHILTLGTCDEVGDGDAGGGAGDSILTHTVACETEAEVLVRWTEMMCAVDPDLVTGYNIFGFDMAYMYDRAVQLGVERRFLALGRLDGVSGQYVEANLSSSALGDNVLKYLLMQGRTTVDLMKEVFKYHKLTSYKLNDVAFHFTKEHKHDVSPSEIFRMQRGSSADRRVIAAYCLQDCVLCNRLVIKLELVANNLGMANVCSVPLSYIFMRGQGVKIFSLVARQCRLEGFLIPTKQKRWPKKGEDAAEEEKEKEEEEGYEGAIVLEPKAGMYLDDPVTVLDYASLYPSSMISENISHDCLVIDPKYGHLRGVDYITITYDTPSGECRCKFAQPRNKGVLPRILEQLLRQRKATRKKMTHVVGTALEDGSRVVGTTTPIATVVREESGRERECVPGSVVSRYDDFQKAVLDGLQNAYKVTANSLYGQMGAPTSPLYLKHVAACTTATGRSLILRAKAFMEKELGANIIYGDTDSLFIVFDTHVTDGEGNRVKLQGKEALRHSIAQAHEASRLFKPHLKPPHDLEYDKTFWPFIIFSKKRYVGNLYEDDVDSCTQKSMGIALKRRDYAPIVKEVYGGIIDIILNHRDIPRAVAFLKGRLRDLAQGNTPLAALVITKTLKATYKDPERIAHHVLAQRIGERDPGNKPQVNDRVPYVYVDQGAGKNANTKHADGRKKLQGERIEDPGYVTLKKLRPDYGFYITNQIMKPVLQTFSIVLEELEVLESRRRRPPHYWDEVYMKYLEEAGGNTTKARDRFDRRKEAEVKELLFDPHLIKLDVARNNMREISDYFAPKETKGTTTGAKSTNTNTKSDTNAKKEKDDGVQKAKKNCRQRQQRLNFFTNPPIKDMKEHYENSAPVEAEADDLML